MNTAKLVFNDCLDYLKAFAKWIILAVLVGIIGGVIGSIFHNSIDLATEFRTEHPQILYLLPIGGLVIAGLYHLFKKQGRIDTNRFLDSAGGDEKVPLVMAPLIFISTVITHLLGGSAGREGAALQLGGSIGYNVGKLFRLEKSSSHIIVMSGMSAVFAALFGTPLTAAVFALEVVFVGTIHYAALMPCLISAITAYRIALMFGITPVHFDLTVFGTLTAGIAAKAIVLALLCAVLSIGFCSAIKLCEKYMKKYLANRYLRAVVGGVIIVLLTLLVGTYDYNGAGMDVVTRAMNGEVRPEAFLLKIIFTSITISAGFKGGEIVPAFFVGSTFGCFAGGLLGLDPAIGAAIGFVALFCGAVNCPLASIMLSLEVFGGESMAVLSIVCAVSYMMSGCFGLYKSQKIVYSKINEDLINKSTH